MKKSLIALAFGTFALGMAEFVMMSILPYVAASMRCSIPEAGHLISAYAIGVCVGAPSVVLVARKRPLHKILLCLMLIYLTGNAMMSFCSDLHLGMLFRFISGLPHGAYFGVGSIVADRLASRGKSTSAIAVTCSGMTVANLVGIPIGSWLSEMVSWRVIFLFNSLWGVLTFILLYRFIPHMEPLPNTGLKGQFHFLKSAAPWLIMAATTFGNGGIFCWYSYISPLMNKIAGFSPSEITLLMVLAGGSMCVGNLIGCRLSDRYTPGKTILDVQSFMVLALLTTFFFASDPGIAVLAMCICTACLFGVSAPQQLLLLRFSKGGEMMGAALVQVAFNLGNAVGAYCGGLPITCGFSYNYPALVGTGFVVVGILATLTFCRKYRIENANI
ncbi:MAG: MFS transporter AraJ [Paraprevotella sp.]|nr:MFS transporter AraJ [Paraprevotella sp.]